MFWRSSVTRDGEALPGVLDDGDDPFVVYFRRAAADCVKASDRSAVRPIRSEGLSGAV
jgi:hypothetical protein